MLASAARREVSLAHMPASKGTRGFATRAFDLGHSHIPFPATKRLFSHVHVTIRRSIPRLTRLFGAPKPGVTPFSLLRLAFQPAETIQQRLSFSSRIALSRPLSAAGIPRLPTIARPVHEVGLGAVRKFSSQTTFRHAAENMSITGRAFWGADWDVETNSTRSPRTIRRTKHNKQNRIAPKRNVSTFAARRSESPADDASQMSLYFPHESRPEVTTILQIALAPTPTATLPLTSSNEATYMLPLRSILSNQAAFQASANDVAAIFAKLDEAGVWRNGVSIDTWGDTNGLCVELRIKFLGWPMRDVRHLLGQLADIPACALQEMHSPEESEFDYNDYPLIARHDLLDFIMPSMQTPSSLPLLDNCPTPTSPALSDSLSLDFGGDVISDGSMTPLSSNAISEWGDPEYSFISDTTSEGSRLSLSATFLSHVQSLDSVGIPTYLSYQYSDF